MKMLLQGRQGKGDHDDDDDLAKPTPERVGDPSPEHACRRGSSPSGDHIILSADPSLNNADVTRLSRSRAGDVLDPRIGHTTVTAR